MQEKPLFEGLDETNALFEAGRCLSYCNCFECDNCYGVFLTMPSPRFEFKYDYYKGCGICSSEYPCSAIKMVAEDI